MVEEHRKGKAREIALTKELEGERRRFREMEARGRAPPHPTPRSTARFPLPL